MDTYTVKDLMVPISEYATVNEGATLYEAVLALEKAQEEYDFTKYRHRAILVMDKNGQAVGKLSHMAVLRAIEIQPDEKDFFSLGELSGFGFTPKLLRSLVAERRRENISWKELCQNVSKIKVEAIMHAPTEGEYVEPETTLDLAIHQMIEGHHMALLVAREKQIVGILRLSDVFGAIFHTMKECENDNQ